MMDRIVERIREGKSFLISSHVRLDGDGIASALAVHLLLKMLDKELSARPLPAPIMLGQISGGE